MDEEERTLWEKYAETRAVEDRNVLVERFSKLAKGAAVGVFNKLPHNVRSQLTVDDLWSAASVGLIGAVEKFELHRGWKFATFALQRLRGAVLDYLRDVDPVKRSHRAKIKQGEAPDVVTRSIDETISTTNNGQAVSLKELDEALTIDPETDPQFWFWSDVEFTELLRPLHGIEEEVVRLYYGSTLTMRQIGERLGLSESRISQVHSRAIHQLREIHIKPPTREAAADPKPALEPLEKYPEEESDLMQEFFQQFRELKLPEIDRRIKDLEGELRAMKVLRDAVHARDQEDQTLDEAEAARHKPGDEQPTNTRQLPLGIAKGSSVSSQVVAALYEIGPCKPKEIRDALGMGPERTATISSSLQNLQKAGRAENRPEGWMLTGAETALEKRRRDARDADPE